MGHGISRVPYSANSMMSLLSQVLWNAVWFCVVNLKILKSAILLLIVHPSAVTPH